MRSFNICDLSRAFQPFGRYHELWLSTLKRMF
jgi:hypothetical protein